MSSASGHSNVDELLPWHTDRSPCPQHPHHYGVHEHVDGYDLQRAEEHCYGSELLLILLDQIVLVLNKPAVIKMLWAWNRAKDDFLPVKKMMSGRS